MWYNRFVNLILRSPLHGLISHGIMLIIYTGRKSGQTYATPISYVYEEESVLLTTSFRHRAWWRNLRDNPPVTLRLRGRDVPATVELFTEDADVAHYLTVYIDRQPKMADYCYVALDGDGRPNPTDLAAAAAKRVIVRTTLRDKT